MPDSDLPVSIDEGRVDPKMAAALEKSVKGKEQAPNMLEQSGSITDWKRLLSELGAPFDAENVPLRKLAQMRRDPMIAFGLHYKKTPLVRANWHVEARDKNGPNAQVAGFLDEAWRMVHASYVFQHTLCFDYGFQGIVKRFQLRNPGGVYEDMSVDSAEGRLKPVWSEGSVEPVIWKPFVPLRPDRVEPMFDDKTGEFTGIRYEVPPAQRQRGLGFKSRSKKDNQTHREIDVWHSLWATNEKHSVFGSMFGYPLIAHAYRYWWSYWFRWAQADRAFERQAVPPLIAYHPEGNWEDPENPGEKIPYYELALNAAEQLRANAIAAVPSKLAGKGGLEDNASNLREWEFKFLESDTEGFKYFHESFNYLDVMKLRSIWVPEQAFIEGEGGTSSRNVAAQMAEIFIESQANTWEEIADHINRYIFPQLLVINFPEFVNNGGTARIVGHGFAKEDIELMKQLIQVIGQADPDKLGVDIREGMQRLNVPLLSPLDQWKEEQRIAGQAAATPPPAVNGRGGVNVRPLNPGQTNGGSVPEPAAPGSSVLGFDDQSMVYANPDEHIYMSADADFLNKLPDSKHYSDEGLRALAALMRKVWVGHMRELYPNFAAHISATKLEFADDDLSSAEVAGGVITAAAAKREAERLLKEWDIGDNKIRNLATRSGSIIRRIMKRALSLEQKALGVPIEVEEDKLTEWIASQAGRLVKLTHETVVDELRQFLVRELQKGNTQNLARDLTEHFADFPMWKAARIARSEVRDAVNASTLFTGEAAGLRYCQALDGEDFDEDCKKRNGKLFTIREAWKEMRKEHSNGTLGFNLMPRASFSIENVEVLPEDAQDGAEAYFDQETDTAYILASADVSDADRWLGQVAERMLREPSQINV